MAIDEPASDLDPGLSNLIGQYFSLWRSWAERGAITEPQIDDDLNTTFRLRTAVICFFIHQDVKDITVASQGRPVGRNERIYDIEFRANIVVAAAKPDLFEYLIRRTGTTTPAATLGVIDYNPRLVVVQAHARYSDCGNVPVDIDRHVHPFFYTVQELGKDIIQRFGGVPFTLALDGADLRSSYIPPSLEQPHGDAVSSQIEVSSPPPVEAVDQEQEEAEEEWSPEDNQLYFNLLEMAGLAYVLIAPTDADVAVEYLTETLRVDLERDPESLGLHRGQAHDNSFDILLVSLESPEGDESALIFWSGDHVGALAAQLCIKSFHRYARKELGAELLAVKKGELLNIKGLMASPPKIKTTGETISEGAIAVALRTMRPVVVG